jgi:phage gpG-like protein
MSTLTRWAARAGDSAPAMEGILDYMEMATRLQFESEGSRSGRPWAPDKQSTIDRREESGQTALGGDLILQASGDLMRSLTEREDQNAIRHIGPGFAIYGTRLGYADIMKKGFTDRAGHSVQARRPVDFTRRDRYVIVKMLGSWITGNVRAPLKPSLKFLSLG